LYQRLATGVQEKMIRYSEGRAALRMAGGIEVHQTIAGREEEFWIARERVPIDGFTGDAIPALDRLPVVHWNVEGVVARILSGEWATSGRIVIVQG
jgi:hypothetical protein